jgi:hypothetical protein
MGMVIPPIAMGLVVAVRPFREILLPGMVDFPVEALEGYPLMLPIMMEDISVIIQMLVVMPLIVDHVMLKAVVMFGPMVAAIVIGAATGILSLVMMLV